jgi:Bacterial PH domain
MAVTLTVNPRHRQLGGIEFPDRGRDVLHVSGPESPARLNGGTMDDVDKLVFRIPAVALLAAATGFICATPLAFAVPGLQVLYVLPIAFAVWVVRNRTTVTSTRITARSTFGTRVVEWDDVKAIKLGKSWLSVVVADDKLVRLPGVRMMHLEALAVVSGGRITAPTVKPEVAEAVEDSQVPEVLGASEVSEAPVVDEAAGVEDADVEDSGVEDKGSDREDAKRA